VIQRVEVVRTTREEMVAYALLHRPGRIDPSRCRKRAFGCGRFLRALEEHAVQDVCERVLAPPRARALEDSRGASGILRELGMRLAQRVDQRNVCALRQVRGWDELDCGNRTTGERAEELEQHGREIARAGILARGCMSSVPFRLVGADCVTLRSPRSSVRGMRVRADGLA
jgi:hypothetical protein